jgi:hypothetical protein
MREVLVDLFEVSAREKRSTFVKVVVACLIAAVLAPPLAQAAVTRIKGTVKIKDSGGGAIDSAATGPLGIFEAAGSNGAVATRNFAGGGGFLGAVDCDAATTVVPASSEINNSIVTAVLVSGSDATFEVTAAALGGAKVLEFDMDANNNQGGFTSPTGLTLTAALTFTCTAGTDGNLVVLGQ